MNLKLKYLFALLLCCLSLLPLHAAEKKVAFLGDSICYGGHWPALIEGQLRQDPKYKNAEIINFGLPSETIAGMSEPGHAGGRFPRPCLFERLGRVVSAFRPDLVIACYGMNDGLMQPFDEVRFEAYQKGAQRLKSEMDVLGAQIIFVTPSPYRLDQNPDGDVYDKVLERYGQWLVSQRQKGWQVVDMRKNLLPLIVAEKKERPNFVFAGDGVHPGAEGHRLMAKSIWTDLARYLKMDPKAPLVEGNEYNLLHKKHCATMNEWLGKTKHRRPEISGYDSTLGAFKHPKAQQTEWHGFQKFSFKVDGREATVIMPKESLPGTPWVWRLDSLERAPELVHDFVDKGFYVVYIDMKEMYGSPASMKVMDTFYEALVKQHGFSPRCILDGSLAGALFAVNWANLHPSYVAAMVLDNPVCDIKSWPGGFGKSEGSPAEWDKVKLAYKLSDAQGLTWKINFDKLLKPIAAAKIPILLLEVPADNILLPAEHSDILKKTYEKLGGPITSLPTEGTHEDHRLVYPSAIFNFLLGAVDLPKEVTIVCIGDSITYGVGADESTRWTTRLQNALGLSYRVEGLGVSARTLLRSGDHPYKRERMYGYALALNGDIYFIALGTNDSKPQNWKLKDQFESDYKAYIQEIRKINPKAQIYCVKAVPVNPTSTSINDDIVRHQINPLIEKIAKDEKCKVVDLYSPLLGKYHCMPDGVHPNAEGHALMVGGIYKALKGRSLITDEKTVQWNGYQTKEFMLNGRQCKLVLPKSPAPGKPWIWRTEFFGHEPQADLALLENGYYVAYIDLQDLYGCPASMEMMNDFYGYLKSQYKLSDRVVLEGFSRGGLFAFNWAACNPTCVAGLYVDAPVCDFKSWPGGKGKGKGSPDDWAKLFRAYDFTEATALAYKLNPVDNLAPLAKAKIPILAVVGEADDVVPVSENMDLVEKRYKALGGKIKVIRKPGVNHHPHSLADPKPIVDFVLKIK